MSDFLDWAELQADVADTISGFGLVTQRAYTVGAYDPATGEATTSTADSTRRGVVLDFGAGQTLCRGTLIQQGDKRLLLDAVAPVNMQDHFIVNSVEYVVVSIGEINPAGTCVLYDIHLKT
ncbi:MAG: hypothetical protein PHG89_10790 [Gallionella sp.]|nr:hypothetical protein [Gallionella sp.]